MSAPSMSAGPATRRRSSASRPGANIVYVAATAVAMATARRSSSSRHRRSSRSPTSRARRVGVGKGTSAHNLLVAALEKAGVGFDEITPVYLSPADAAAAFASDQIDAWAVWDPFFAIAETRYQPRVLATLQRRAQGQHLFPRQPAISPRRIPKTVTTTIAALGEAATWADANRDKVAAALHEVTGVPLDAQTLAANRANFGIFPITDEIIASQQATADRFYKLGLIPNAVAHLRRRLDPRRGN